jgi:hypothetical protein
MFVPEVTLPNGVVMVKVLLPDVVAGVTNVNDVSLTTVKDVTEVTDPIITLVVPVKSAPVTVIVVPPETVAEFGVNEVMDGGATKVIALAAVTVPIGYVKTMSRAPAVKKEGMLIFRCVFSERKFPTTDPPIVIWLTTPRFVP